MIALLAVAGCGSGGSNAEPAFSGKDVERAFGKAGIVLRPVPSNGAEQPAMGETSPCATRYLGARTSGSIIVTVCDTRGAAAGIPTAHVFRRRRANVVVDYSGIDPRTRTRISAALDGLG